MINSVDFAQAPKKMFPTTPLIILFITSIKERNKKINSIHLMLCNDSSSIFNLAPTSKTPSHSRSNSQR